MQASSRYFVFDYRTGRVSVLNIILGALLPVIVTLGLGMLAGWRKDENSNAAQSLNKMVLVYALPLTLFAGTITIPRKELISDWQLLVVLLIGTLLPYVVAFGFARFVFKRDLQAAALQALAFGLPAVAFTGIPILQPLIHGETTIVVDFIGLTTSVIILPATLLILSYAQPSTAAKGSTGDGQGQAGSQPTTLAVLRNALFQPIVMAPMLAILLVLVNLHLPGTLTNSLRLLGGTVGGVSLFASGIIIQAKVPGFSVSALLSTFGRLLLIPGLAFLIFHFIGHSQSLMKMTVLGLALPAAPMQVILATRFKCFEDENAAVLLYTTVLCIPTLALFIVLTK